tara:strand:- start:3889 stop:4770 length:882 start_codon:yes stop_codon:yes gene_type:complete
MYYIKKHFLIIFAILFSCSRNDHGVIKTDNGYMVNFFRIGSGHNGIFKGCILNLNISATDDMGNDIFSTEYHGMNSISSFYYDSTILKSPLNDVFLKTCVGDSFSFNVSSKIFFNTFFGEKYNYKNFILRCPDSLRINIKNVAFNNSKEQQEFNLKLKESSIISENRLLSEFKKQWDTSFVNIYKYKGLYSIKVASSDRISPNYDTLERYLSLKYTITDLRNRLLYSTNFNYEFYDNNLNNQLLEGFEILTRRYEKGDSIVAIIPSELLFEERGSFINKIPPYTPAIVNLRIN